MTDFVTLAALKALAERAKTEIDASEAAAFAEAAAKASAAQSAAEATAAADATAKANAAQTAAETTAAADATAKANAAQAAAEATASADATEKANTAEANAKAHAEAQASAAQTAAAADATSKANTAEANAKAYTDEMKNAILGEGISETFDTLKEIQNWIEGDGVNATELTTAIADEAKARGEADAVFEERVKALEDAEAVKVEDSETNGYIKINGVETEVYALPDTVLHGEVATNEEVAAMLNEVFASVTE